MKKVIYSFFAIAFSGVAWYFFSVAALNLNHINFGSNIISIVLFLVAIAISYAFMFVIALNKDRLDFSITNLLSALWLLLFLGTSLATIISAVALFIATEVIIEFSHALQNSISLRYFSTAYTKIALVALVLIGISAGYIQQNLNRTVAQENFTTNSSNFLWPAIKGYFNEFDSDQSVNQFITTQLKEQGISNPQPYMLAQQRQRLSDQFGVTVTGNEKMSDLGKIFLGDQISSFLKKFNFNKTGLYIIFFSLLILWPLWRFFFAITAVALYWILRHSGQIRVVDTQVTAKHLEV